MQDIKVKNSDIFLL